MQVNETLTATIELSARVLVNMPVATAYCTTVAITDFVLLAMSQCTSQDFTKDLRNSRLKGTFVPLEVVTQKTSNQHIGCKFHKLGSETIDPREGSSENAPAAPVVKTAMISAFPFPNSSTAVWVIIRMVTMMSRTSVAMQIARINPTTK